MSQCSRRAAPSTTLRMVLSPARLRRAGEEVAGAYPDGQRVSTMWVASSIGTVSVTR